MRSVSRRFSRVSLARRFVHTLVPIAFAYVLAHYFSLLVWQGQAIGYLASNPLGHGTNYFGTAGWHINYNFINSTAIWYVQVLALVAGHVSALALAHDRALATYPTPAAGDPLAILDARRDGRLHKPRAVAALGGQHLRGSCASVMLAHIGNIPVEEWVPFLVPVVLLYLWGRRSSRKRDVALQRLSEQPGALSEATAARVLKSWSDAGSRAPSTRARRALLPAWARRRQPGGDRRQAARRARAEVDTMLDTLAELGYIDLDGQEGDDRRRGSPATDISSPTRWRMLCSRRAGAAPEAGRWSRSARRRRATAASESAGGVHRYRGLRSLWAPSNAGLTGTATGSAAEARLRLRPRSSRGSPRVRG